MTDINKHEEQKRFRAEATSLWKITFGPLVWAVHFVATYGLTALTCAKGWPLDPLRIGVGVGTVLALAGILWLGWGAWAQWDTLRDREWENDAPTDEDRHQFLGHAAFLLSIISFIGVVYVALPILLFGSCQ
ncbi:hypothetical protein [Thalassorhabdomicrobium marinisediminis]|uniref:Transmembrane protein n=1 Tax=Thalassorhabdomicrobium marinisediminis TaxID=2170577 RepID=A0A2T7FTT4_9RHOB|nr:hypothetical protein [Thalassorhabdomicrobium marinisediminis]PVA05564.1 hypothetical protein DC363_14910 [Thalassorhabdomicrobium marinisediminis]